MTIERSRIFQSFVFKVHQKIVEFFRFIFVRTIKFVDLKTFDQMTFILSSVTSQGPLEQRFRKGFFQILDQITLRTKSPGCFFLKY